MRDPPASRPHAASHPSTTYLESVATRTGPGGVAATQTAVSSPGCCCGWARPAGPSHRGRRREDP
eukprot:6076242-Lingulodinium_polyedra.AAC.1